MSMFTSFALNRMKESGMSFAAELNNVKRYEMASVYDSDRP